MSIARHNKKSRFGEINLDKVTVTSLADLHADGEKTHIINAIMFSDKGEYGRSCFLVFDGDLMVWLPNHLLKVCEEICESVEDVTQIKDGKAGFEVREYEISKGANKGTTAYTIEFIDI